MKNLVRLSSVMAVSVMLTSCGEGNSGSGVEGCEGIDLRVEQYRVAKNVHLYVKNSTDEPMLVDVRVVSNDGKVADRSLIQAPANGIGEDKSGTYVPRDHEVIIVGCS